MTAEVRTEESPTRVAAVVSAVQRAIFPAGGPYVVWPEAALVWVLGSVAAFFRLGGAAFAGRPWAEDGSVFLQQAHQVGPLRSVSVQYAGYLSVGPRLATAVVYVLPLAWQGIGLHVAAAAIEALVGLIAYAATAAHVPQRWARALVALCVVAVPVGPEVTGNIANLQWFLMFGAAVALVWTPRSWFGWTALCALVVIATTSSPFGFVIVVVSGFRLLAQHSRPVVIVFVATIFGFAVQTVAMIHARGRQAALHHELGLRHLAEGYNNRVLGDGVFGIGRLSLATHRSVEAGLVTAVVLLLLASVLLIRRTRSVAFAAGLIALSVVTFVLPVGLNAAPIDNPFADSRYYVTPSLFLEVAVIALAARAMPRFKPPARSPLVLGVSWFGAAVAAFAIGSLVYAVIDSYSNASYADRNRGQSWSTGVRVARSECEQAADSKVVTIPILPSGWVVSLTCGEIRSA